MGLSENVGYIPNEIAIFHRDNDQQNHWVQGYTIFRQTYMFQHVLLWDISRNIKNLQTVTKSLYSMFKWALNIGVEFSNGWASQVFLPVHSVLATWSKKLAVAMRGPNHCLVSLVDKGEVPILLHQDGPGWAHLWPQIVTGHAQTRPEDQTCWALAPWVMIWGLYFGAKDSGWPRRGELSVKTMFHLAPLCGAAAKVGRMMNTDPAWGYSECALESRSMGDLWMIYGWHGIFHIFHVGHRASRIHMIHQSCHQCHQSWPVVWHGAAMCSSW